MKAPVLLTIWLAVASCAGLPKADRSGLAFISLERTGCLGSCPIYVVTLYEDGVVRFDGRDFVKKKGTFTKFVDQAAVARVFAKAESVHFWRLRDTFAEAKEMKKRDETVIELPPTDLPTRYVTFHTATKSKRVEDYWGAPSELRELERLIDATADASEWIGHGVTAEEPNRESSPRTR